MLNFPSNAPGAGSAATISPYAIGAGVVGVGLGAISAIQTNNRIKAAVRENYNTIGKQQQTAQQIGYQQQYQLGQEATYQQGAFINQIAGRSGTAYRTVLGQIAADNAINAQNIRDNTANQISALQAEKQNVYNQAKGQMVSPVGQGLTTGANFFGQALQIQSAIANAKIADSAANEAAAAKNIFDNAEKNPAAVYALTQRNLPASVIQGGTLNGLINQDYNNYLLLQQMQFDAARAVRDTNRGLYQ